MCYLGIMNKEKIIYFKNGTRCFIRNKSDAIAFFENYFLKLNTPDKRFEIKSNDTIVDIGAHVGYFTILAAKNANLGTVYSVEPHKESIELLKKNIMTLKLCLFLKVTLYLNGKNYPMKLLDILPIKWLVIFN